MFENLTEKLEKVFKDLRGYGKLTPKNINDALRQVRLALLEADVNFKVVKEFIATISERAVGQEVLDSLTPGQQVIKIVHQELVELLGGQTEKIKLDGKQPVIIMLAGLQGSGKTTTAAKLAKLLKSRGRRPYLIPADVYRPAAIDQLQVLGDSIGVDVHPSETGHNPVSICRNGVIAAAEKNLDTLIIDTAGRLHIDQELMEELRLINAQVEPAEI